MMEIEKNKVVTFHYTLREVDGDYVESTDGKEPAAYLHGYSGIVRGLEREMKGRKAGEKFSVNVRPEDAYGVRDPQAVQRVPLKRLKQPRSVEVGSLVAVDTQQGRYQATVVKVGRFNVDLDFNHPLAGRSFDFDVEILDVREATPEEIAHRHVHGPGGVEH